MNTKHNIILLHGAIGACDQLIPLSEALKSYGHNVYFFSFSGHGRIPFRKEVSIPQFAEELKEFIEHNNLTEPDVFGYSMGGYVALYLAAAHSVKLGKIITLGSKFNWTKEIAQKEIKQLDPDIIREKVPKFAMALQDRHGDDWETLLERTADMMISLGDNNLLSEDLIAKIENEVLIGIADKDAMVSLYETHQVFIKLKNASMYMLPDTKHPIETADVSFLAEIIVKFINKH